MNVGNLIKELEKYPKDMEVMFDFYASKDIHFNEKVEEVSIDKVFKGTGCFENIVFLEEVKGE